MNRKVIGEFSKAALRAFIDFCSLGSEVVSRPRVCRGRWY